MSGIKDYPQWNSTPIGGGRGYATSQYILPFNNYHYPSLPNQFGHPLKPVTDLASLIDAIQYAASNSGTIICIDNLIDHNDPFSFVEIDITGVVHRTRIYGQDRKLQYANTNHPLSIKGYRAMLDSKIKFS